MGKGVALAACSILIILGPKDVPDQCDQLVYARANPAQCYVFPFPQLPGGNASSGSGGNDGGLIGRILHGIGGLL